MASSVMETNTFKSIQNTFVGAFVTWRNHMRLVFADCRVSGIVHARALRNCVRESLQCAALETLDVRLSWFARGYSHHAHH